MESLQEGGKCFVVEVKDGWAKINAPVRGYVRTKTPKGQPALEPQVYKPGWHEAKKDGVNVYARHNTSSDLAGKLQIGEKVKLEQVAGTMARISRPCPGWVELFENYGEVVLEPLSPDDTTSVGGKWHKVLHKCILRKSHERDSELVGYLPQGRVVFVEEVFEDRARLSKIAFINENNKADQAIVSGWVPIITSHGDVVLTPVIDAEEELEKQFHSDTPGRNVDPDNKKDGHNWEDVENAATTPQNPVRVRNSKNREEDPRRDNKNSEEDKESENKNTSETNSFHIPPNDHLIPFESQNNSFNSYGKGSIRKAMERAKLDNKLNPRRSKDDIAFARTNQERNQVKRGDEVLMEGKQGKVIDVIYDNQEQILSVKFPGETQSQMVTRNDVIVLDKAEDAGRISGASTPGGPDGRTDMIEELGAVLHADVVTRPSRFTYAWKKVYGVEPAQAEIDMLMGRSLEITALDLRHATARAVVDGNVLWIPRGALNEKGMPVFILDEDRDDEIEGEFWDDNYADDSDEGEPSAKPVKKVEKTEEIVITREVHKITQRNPKALINANSSVPPDRLEVNKLTEEKLKSVAGKKGKPLQYDFMNDAYLVDFGREQLWIPAEITVVMPHDMEMEPESTTFYDRTTKKVEVWVDEDGNEVEAQEESTLEGQVRDPTKAGFVAESKEPEKAEPYQRFLEKSESPKQTAVLELGVRMTPTKKKDADQYGVPEKNDFMPVRISTTVPEKRKTDGGMVEYTGNKFVGKSPPSSTRKTGGGMTEYTGNRQVDNNTRKTGAGMMEYTGNKQADNNTRSTGAGMTEFTGNKQVDNTKEAVKEYAPPNQKQEAVKEGERQQNTIRVLAEPMKCVITMNKNEIARKMRESNLMPLPMSDLRKIAGKRVDAEKFDTANNTYLVNVDGDPYWIPDGALMALDTPKFLPDRQSQGEPPSRSRGRVASVGDAADLDEPDTAPTQKQDPASRTRKHRTPQRAVITMSRKLLESTWEKSGGDVRHDLLDEMKGQRIEITETDTAKQLCKTKFQGTDLWVPSGALMFLDKPQYADRGPSTSADAFSKTKPTKKSQASSASPKKSQASSPKKQELISPIDCVVTMQLAKLRIHMPRLTGLQLESLKGSTVKASSVDTRDGKKWYRISALGKQMWAPQDILLVKGKGDFKSSIESTSPSRRSSPFDLIKTEAKTSYSSAFSSQTGEKSPYSSPKKSPVSPSRSALSDSPYASIRKSSEGRSPLTTPTRTMKSPYSSNDPFKKRDSVLVGYETRNPSTQFVSHSLSVLRTEWRNSGLAQPSEALLRKVLGARVLASDVDRSKKAIKCIFNGETMWLPMRAVKFIDTSSRF